MIKEIMIENPITIEGQPDGGCTPIVDPYDGCTINCPYCFQRDDEKWNKDIYVHINIAQLLQERMINWPKDKIIYIGSKCDPYLTIEREYKLTRQCLKVLNKWNIPTMITTKADQDIILRDIELLKSFNADLTINMGMSNVNQLKNPNENHNIKIANKLKEEGIKVWAFITPILPKITDVDNIINKLNPDIPVFLDKLRINKETIQADLMKAYITKEHPELTKYYKGIIDEADEEYYEIIKNNYINNPRVRFLFI